MFWTFYNNFTVFRNVFKKLLKVNVESTTK